MNSSGTQTCVGTSCSTTTTYATSKEVYVHKSIPTITRETVSTGTVHTGDTISLYSWKVAASSSGPIALKQQKLAISITDASSDTTPFMYAFKLYKDGVNITSLVTITDEDGHDLVNSTSLLTGASESTSTVIIKWTTEDTVGAGSSSTYRLEATASGFNATASKVGDDAVSVNIPADTSVNAATKKYLNAAATPSTGIVQLATSAGASGVDANLIWSDNSAVSHASTVTANTVTPTSSGDWSNGYLVLNLPTTTTTWTGL